MDVIETPAGSSTGSYREEETSTGRSGERNEDLNLNSQERLGADVLTMYMECENTAQDWKVGECLDRNEEQQA